METKESNKVISLAEKNKKTLDFSLREERHLPVAVVAVRDKAHALLLEKAKQLFAKVDDSLFSMAERAHRQEEQDGLFQALRLLRVERRGISERFGDGIRQAFQVDARDSEGDDPFASFDNLSLVHNDELEQLVAADTMVANAKRDFAEYISELSLRLDSLFAVKIYDKNNPLGPDAICDAFVEAIRPLQMHIRARLTLLKKFEQMVMLQLQDVYEHSNQILIEHGVLPSLNEQRRQARPESPKGTSAKAAATAPAGPGFGQSTGVGGVSASPAACNVSIGGFAPGLLPAAAGLAPMPSGDLLSYLGDLQLSTPNSTDGDMRLLDINDLLQQRLVRDNRAASLTKVDSDTIKLVEMLFSFILEDRSLAAPIKVQLARLQLPLLKVAIADKSFFSKGGHPARKLLNEMAAASTGWQGGENYESDRLYCEVKQIVDRILDEFDQDINIFSLLLQSLRDFIEHERRRANILERRIVDEADGRAKSQAARARVAAVMDALMAERELPQVVQDWLHKVWSNMLFLTCVKEGTESEAWSRDVRTARDLVWSVQAPMPDSCQQLLSLLPPLQERLRAGVEAVSVSTFEARRLFAELKAVYAERFAMAKQLSEERQRLVREQVEQELREQAEMALKSAEPEEVAQDMVQVPEMEELEQLVAEAQVGPKEAGQGALQPLPESDPHWQLTYRLAQGSWFELKRSEEEKFRCRLAAVIGDIDQFIFVNRNGAKVAEFSRLELAHAMRSERLVSLDDGMLFERALQSVIGSVRENPGE